MSADHQKIVGLEFLRGPLGDVLRDPADEEPKCYDVRYVWGKAE
jgi:hypothetical protein